MLKIIFNPISSFRISILFLLTLHCPFLKAIECPTKNNDSCSKFWHQLFKYPGHNLQEGLKCLDYNKNLTSMQALGATYTKQEIHFDTQSLAIIQVDEVKEHLR